MGAGYFIVDDADKRVLDLGKAREFIDQAYEMESGADDDRYWLWSLRSAGAWLDVAEVAWRDCPRRTEVLRQWLDAGSGWCRLMTDLGDYPWWVHEPGADEWVVDDFDGLLAAVDSSTFSGYHL